MSSQEAFAAGEWISKHLNSYGITSIKDPLADRITLETYQSLGKQDKLTLRVAACLRWKSDVGENIDINEQIALIRDREKYASKRINPNFAKLFLDGVVPYKTSAFLEPYIGDEMDNHDWRSTLLIDPEELKKELIYFDKEGITVKMHAIGDAAIRAGLDAIEAARNENGFSGLQHEIAHSVFVNAEDVTRFKKLDAVAEFSPPFWFPSEFHEQNKVNLLGRERADSNYLISSIKSTNALVVYGSDWPVVPLVNPWPGIEALVTRENPYEEYPGKLTPDEAIDIVEAIEMYTINGARSMYLEEYTGSIQVGKFADMIILDRDIFEINPKEIRNTKVLSTLVEGEVVHESSLTFN